PRAARYGEGGPAALLLEDAAFPPGAADRYARGRALVDGREWPHTVLDVDARASLPRLLAPSGPQPVAFVLPYLALFAILCVRIREEPRRLLAALPLCVVASPTGWAMAAVLALPLLNEGPRKPLLAAGWLVCALPGFLPH